MAIVKTDIGSLQAIRSNGDTKYIVKGLSKKRIGFIVSGPDVGKGYLCLSIAYELGSDLNLLNLKGSPDYVKTLYWPIEDGVDEVAKRMLHQLSGLPGNITKQITENVMLWDSSDPLCSLKGGVEIPGSEETRHKLIEACKNVDLLIIDTIREAAGNADEIDDDHVVKNILQDIATKGDVAILLVHHLTKAVIKGQEKVSNVSGSGFSRTQANSRMHLYLEKVDGKAGTEPLVRLSHIKANYIKKEDRLSQMPLEWTEHDILCSKDLFLGSSHVTTLPQSKSSEFGNALDENVELILASQRHIEEVEPLSINIGAQQLSENSKRLKLAREKKDQLVTDDDREKLRQFNEKKRRDQR